MKAFQKKSSVSSGPVSFRAALKKDLKKNSFAYLLIVPVLLWYLVFCYAPMWGILLSFKDYKPLLGFAGSKWVGLKHFQDFLSGPYFFRTIKNTLMLNVWGLAFGFTSPILLALLLNEVKSMKFKKVVQTITYMPHFISLIVICGMIHIFTQSGGILTQLVNMITGTEHASLLGYSNMFRPIYTFSGIWQNIGWDSIIYLSAMSSIDPGLYEAAEIDGAGRLRKMWHVTLPGIRMIVVLMCVLALGNVLNAGFDQVLNLYSPQVYETGDIIDTFIYRIGLIDAQFGPATAMGVFKSAVSCLFISVSYYVAYKFFDYRIF